MPVFDFSNNSSNENTEPVCTYTTFMSNAKEKTPQEPIFVLDNSKRQWAHHAIGKFTNQIFRTSFEFKDEGETYIADILKVDSRFASLLKWLGENHINVRLSGENQENGYAVYKIRETAFGGGTKLSAEDGFLQFMIERLLSSSAAVETEEDEDADEEWFYFQSNGKMAHDKKITYKNKTYYFDGEGKMLTGWVTYDKDGEGNVDEANDFDSDKTYYCDETGARLEKAWIKTTEPDVDDDNADADDYWYYFKSSGKAQTKKGTNINGQTYIFDNRGRMLTGWVAKDTDSNAYLEIGDENSDYYLKQFADVYFCGDEDDGHAKKNKWFKTWRPSEYDAEDDDNDQYWYSIDKNGKVYIPSQSNASKLAYGVKYKLKDAKLEAQNSGATIEFTKKNVNSKSYFFNQDGEMLSQFIEVSANDLGADSGLKAGMYYFGGDDDGSMKTGSQSVKDDNGDSYKFFFENKTTGNTKGLGITGNKSGYLYFKGLLIKADDYKYQLATITDENGVEHTFIVNKNGSIQKNRVDYKEDNEVLFTTKNLPKDAFVTDSTAWKYSLKDGLTVEADITTPINIYDVMPQN